MGCSKRLFQFFFISFKDIFSLMFLVGFSEVTSAAHTTSEGRSNEDENWLIEIRRNTHRLLREPSFSNLDFFQPN